MSNSHLITQLYKRALETVQESSELFEKAIILMKEGKHAQATVTQELARQKRNESQWLVSEAQKLEDKDLMPF
ncbi:MAG: hypothetical protein ABR568_16900 [Pyrinomonadaceae bacterium]